MRQASGSRRAAVWNVARAGVWAVALGAAGGGLSGCQDALFSPRESRTQYDRYDRSRNQYEPQYVEDEFGVRVPNLRGRLTPKA